MSRRNDFARRLLCNSSILAPRRDALSPGSGFEPSDTLQNARALAAANHLEQANEILSTLVASDPKNLPAWQQLGEVQLAQSLNDDAMGSFEAVLKAEPESSPAQAGEVRAAIAAALADRAAGNSDRALACLVRAKGYVPKSPELLIAFGIQADSMQIYKDADEALSEALRLEPQNEKALYALAHVELDEQKTDSSRRPSARLPQDQARRRHRPLRAWPPLAHDGKGRTGKAGA